MPLSSGARLGPFEITALIGAGGMGEVYRARDTRLGRTVAIKIVQGHEATDPDFRQRLEREAHAISQLNHAHICTLHDIGRDGEVDYLVFEYVDGETLAARIERGPLPVPEALEIGVQICEALEMAHRSGIIHRDLKPANVMITKSGVKLLDFGLAGSVSPPLELRANSGATTMSPLTGQGILVGTFPYMAPEQVQGKPADARTDIWAFGCVLYEMVTGKRAFDGESPAGVIAAILERDPPAVSSVQPLAPDTVDSLVKNCLAKDAVERWQAVHDVLLTLRSLIAADPSLVAHDGRRISPARRERVAWAMIAILVFVIAVVSWVSQSAPEDNHTWHVAMVPPPDAMIRRSIDMSVISPDGHSLVSTGATDGQTLLWVRPLDSTAARWIDGTAGALQPFWSPDSRFIAFFTPDGNLRKVSSSGGPVSSIANGIRTTWGGTWGSNGTIVFAAGTPPNLWRVSDSGGRPEPLTTVDTQAGEAGHKGPQFFPDGRMFLYFGDHQDSSKAALYLRSLDVVQPTRLVSASSTAWVASSGHILYVSRGTLVAQPLDLKQFVITGPAVPVGVRVVVDFGFADFSVSRTGVLAYLPVSESSRLAWYARDGTQRGTLGEPRQYAQVTLSPDDTKVASQIEGDIWTIDLRSGVSSRLTFDSAGDGDPVWSPDSRQLLFFSYRQGRADLYRTSIGGGQDEAIQQSNEDKFPEDWFNGGRDILFTGFSGNTVYILPVAGDRKPRRVYDSPFPKNEFHVSPNGRWVAYNSAESGRMEVYVAAFPDFVDKQQVSSGGGSQALWRRDGGELFYLGADGKLMSADVEAGPPLAIEAPRALFQTRAEVKWFLDQYAVTRDGQRFLIIEPSQEPIPQIVINWPAALGR